MNNSKIALDKVSLSLDEPVDNTEQLRKKEGEIVNILEAIGVIKESTAWSTLKTVFEGRVENLEKHLKIEAESLKLNEAEIYRLQGKLYEARKYDLTKLTESYRLELSNIRKLTQPTER